MTTYYIKFCSLFGVRPRYLFTRHNKLRLRYLMYIWLAVFTFALINRDSQGIARTVDPYTSVPAIASLNPAYQASKPAFYYHESPAAAPVAYPAPDTTFIQALEVALFMPEDVAGRTGHNQENLHNSVPHVPLYPALVPFSSQALLSDSTLSETERHLEEANKDSTLQKESFKSRTLRLIRFTSAPDDKARKQDVPATAGSVLQSALYIPPSPLSAERKVETARETVLSGAAEEEERKTRSTPLTTKVSGKTAEMQGSSFHNKAATAHKVSFTTGPAAKIASLPRVMERDGRTTLQESSFDREERQKNIYLNKYTVGTYPVPPPIMFPVDSGVSSYKKYKVEAGDTFAEILHKAGVSPVQAHKIIAAAQKSFDPRYLRIGQRIGVEFRPNRVGKVELAKVTMPMGGVKTLAVHRWGEDNFSSHIEELELNKRLSARAISIETSLYGSALKQRLPLEVVDMVLRIYAWDIDFQRDLRKGDRLEILYEEYTDEEDEVVGFGDLHYANLSVKGKSLPVYRFKTAGGRYDYFEPDGRSIRKTLMMTPIDGARISSGYGMRHHPILGYSKMHKGVDFAAPIGTPVYAAGDGVIERMNRYGAYGNYVRIRHNRQLKTAYAHLKGFKKGLSSGTKIKQGDVIGYLGNTGRSTGPHLHYEVLLNGKQVNPGSLDLPNGIVLAGKEKERFEEQLAQLQAEYNAYLNADQFALVGDKPKNF